MKEEREERSEGGCLKKERWIEGGVMMLILRPVHRRDCNLKLTTVVCHYLWSDKFKKQKRPMQYVHILNYTYCLCIDGKSEYTPLLILCAELC